MIKCVVIYSHSKERETPERKERKIVAIFENVNLRFYESFDYATNKKYWWTERDADGRFAEIQRNDVGGFNLYVCDFYKSSHDSLQGAMDEAEKYVGEHIVSR